MLKRSILGLSLTIVAIGGILVYQALAASTYAVTETTATVGTATNLEIEYTVDTAAQTWADDDTLTVTLPDNFPIWSALTFTAEYDTDATNNGSGETAITAGALTGQYSTDGARVLTVKWNVTGWGAVVNGASTVRILVTGGAAPLYTDATSTFTFGGTTVAADTNPSGTDDVNVSAADATASVTLGANSVVGTAGVTTITLTTPFALDPGDTIDITFPDFVDISGAAEVATGTFDDAGATITCDDTAQVLTCTVSVGATGTTGTIILQDITTKYIGTTDITVFEVEDEGVAANDIATDTSVALTDVTVADAVASVALGTNSVVGTAGDTTVTISVGYALDANDTIDIAFPAFIDTTNVGAGVTGTLEAAANITCANNGGNAVICTTDGTTLSSGTIIMTGIVSKYVGTTDITDVQVEDEGVAANDIAIDTVVALTDTTAADPDSSVNIAGINEINETGNVVFTFDVDYAMVSGDTVAFTLPANFNVASAAYGSDTFTGVTNFSGCTVASQTITCTVGVTGLPVETGTLTLSGITAASVADASTYTTTLYDTSATANIATASNDTIAATVADTTAPTVVDDWSLNMNTGMIVINFSEAMAAVDVNEAAISIQQSNDTDVAGELYTLTDSTSVWSDSNTLTITLSTTDINAIKADSGLGVSTGTSFLEIVAGSLLTDASTGTNALDLTNVTDGACIDATTFTADTTAPTVVVTATSVNNGGDTIVLTYNEPMDVTTLTQADVQGGTVMGLDYSDDAGNTNAANITTTNATAAWSNGNKTLTITLNEATDGAYIPSGKYIGATSDGSIQDMAAVAQATAEIYSAAGITAEAVIPTYTVAGTSNNDADDTIVLTFNEPMATATIDIDSLTGVTSITDSIGGALTFTNATGVWTGKTVYTITLNEATDVAYIRNGATLSVVLPATVTDLASNAVAQTPVVSEAVAKEAVIPTVVVTAASINNAGDTITLTYNEPMDQTSLTTADVQAGVISLDYSDDAGNTGEANIVTTNATSAWSVGGTVLTITLNEAIDGAYIPDGKFIGATSDGTVADLAGNFQATAEVYTAAGIGDEDTIPTYTATGASVSGAGDTITLQFSEPMATATIDIDSLVGVTSITGSTSGAFTLTNATGVWSGGRTVYTITLNEATDNAFFVNGETATVVLPVTVTDLSGNAEAGVGVVSAAVTAEAVVPTYTAAGVSVTNAGDTITLTFNEPMATATLSNTTGITSITDSVGGALTLANDTGSWTGKTVYTITLNEATDGAFIRNNATVSVILAATVLDLAGNPVGQTPVVSAAVPRETTAPTMTNITGSSNHNAGDTIAITFSEPMDVSTITTALLQANTNITLDYSDDAGNTNAADITVANATVAWTGQTLATITLNEGTDSAYIPNGKFIGVTLGSVTDLAGTAVAGTEIYSAAVAKESTQPTITSVVGNSVNAGGDTVVITSNEVLASTAATIGNWTIQYDDNGAGLNIQTVTLANASATIDATKKIVTITLDEITDGASIPSSKYVKATPHATNVTDLVGNGSIAAVYSAAVASESTAPTISAVSVADGATDVAIDATISITLSEALNQSTVNSNTVKLYTDVGNNNAVNIGTDTEVAATVSLENNGASTKIYINPNSNLSNSGNYIYRVSTGVKDLSGNSLAANADYDFTTVAAGAAPTVTAQTPTNGAINQAVTVSPTVTFSEAMDASTVNTNTVQLRALTGDAIINSVVTYNVASHVVTIDPVASLSNGTSYYIWVSGAKNAAGTTMTAYTTGADQDFATVAAGVGTFGVVSTTMTKLTGTADDTYGNGWEWVIRMTLPTNQNDFALKFNNWVSGSNTLAAASNMQYYSEQIAAGSGSSGTPITITTADTYPSNVTVSTDADATLDGIQTDIHVKVKIPAATAAGSYSTSYRVNYE